MKPEVIFEWGKTPKLPEQPEQIHEFTKEDIGINEVLEACKFVGELVGIVIGWAEEQIKKDGLIKFVQSLGDEYRALKTWANKEI